MTSLAPLLNGMAGRQAPGWPRSRYRAGLGQNRHAAAIPELGLDAARIARGPGRRRREPNPRIMQLKTKTARRLVMCGPRDC